MVERKEGRGRRERRGEERRGDGGEERREEERRGEVRRWRRGREVVGGDVQVVGCGVLGEDGGEGGFGWE